MSKDIFSIQLEVVDIISTVLMDLYDADTADLSDAERQEVRDNFAKISEILIDELGLSVTAYSDGVATAELRPPNGWN